jgi:hypothetical protein
MDKALICIVYVPFWRASNLLGRHKTCTLKYVYLTHTHDMTAQVGDSLVIKICSWAPAGAECRGEWIEHISELNVSLALRTHTHTRTHTHNTHRGTYECHSNLRSEHSSCGAAAMLHRTSACAGIALFVITVQFDLFYRRCEGRAMHPLDT